ncbi:MAG: hypothetical protein BPH100C_131 [Phage 5P_2]|nr:MAG: hypothetical protein BPH100C_131 [Phage 5P_2]
MKKPTRGEVLAERMAKFIGSWTFIILQAAALASWILFNVTVKTIRWDPYPFILLNLMLSFQAAFTGPLLLIAANRQKEIDRQYTKRILHLTEAISVLIEAQKKVLASVSSQIEEIHDEIVDEGSEANT